MKTEKFAVNWRYSKMPSENTSSANSAAHSAHDFLSRWEASAAAERANYQLFLSELCDFLDLPRPNPTVANDEMNTYVFERSVHFQNGDGTTSVGRIDLYKHGCFVLEAKQGSNQTVTENGVAFPQPRTRRGTAVRGTHGWDEAMLAARGQAEQYAKALPVSDGWPPFLVVVDVGHSFELYADFSLTGKAYLPFPDPRNYRVLLRSLEETVTRERLRSVWLDPLSLDPSRHTAEVTKGVAGRLALLARALETRFPAERVASFLMRCIFTSFAEDVRLLPHDGWKTLLRSLEADVDNFPAMVSSLWQTMNDGGFSPILREHVLKFNGGLFETVEALPVDAAQLALLIEAAKANWRDVEPAIFGTLLERALAEDERHRLGAHYTPRAYVERLVVPTIVEPLRYHWNAVQAAAVALSNDGHGEEAILEVKKFLQRLCNTRVLDPACGSGNFLYVSLEHLKRLEGEVLDTLHSLGESQEALEHTGFTVDPHQLLGIEVNPRAAVITDLVLWIGYLQWHFRNHGDAHPPEPVIRRFHNIQHRDALLEWDRTAPKTDENGDPITQWDGVTTKIHPATGEEVPDEDARRAVLNYVNPRKADWPDADFIIGNPPFIGNWRMRGELGDGYAEALRATYTDVPESADYVMYWWERAAELARADKVRRFGFITTNSLPQVFNRAVVAHHLNASHNPLSIVYAVPDHPWIDSSDGAAVRISMTVGEKGEHAGLLCRVVGERSGGGDALIVELEEKRGRIFADLRIGSDVPGAKPLKANDELCCRGVVLHGSGFIVTEEEARLLGVGRIPGIEHHIRAYRNGRDITGISRGVLVIDLFGLTADEVRECFPEVYQWVWDRVKPERDQNPRESRRTNWWIFGEPISTFRPALRGLRRYITTSETAKHRFFVFLDVNVLPDNRLVNFAFEDAYFLGVLSSVVHTTWALRAGGTLEDRPVYNKTRCFDPFPFPACNDDKRDTVRQLGEELDAHRKRQQSLHPDLSLTEMYNVLSKLRANEPLAPNEQRVYQTGLISVLKQTHDELDEAVCEAYGWPLVMTDEEILQRVVALNAERRAEEQTGVVRWLRPEYQQPEARAVQAALGLPEQPAVAAAPARRTPWPAGLADQVRVVKDVLRANEMLDSDSIASRFVRARRTRVDEILETLTALGQIRNVEGRYVL
jgi:hypothetical protein